MQQKRLQFLRNGWILKAQCIKPGRALRGRDLERVFEVGTECEPLIGSHIEPDSLVWCVARIGVYQIEQPKVPPGLRLGLPSGARFTGFLPGTMMLHPLGGLCAWSGITAKIYDALA